jgi:hypothetical protein
VLVLKRATQLPNGGGNFALAETIVMELGQGSLCFFCLDARQRMI